MFEWLCHIHHPNTASPVQYHVLFIVYHQLSDFSSQCEELKEKLKNEKDRNTGEWEYFVSRLCSSLIELLQGKKNQKLSGFTSYDRL